MEDQKNSQSMMFSVRLPAQIGQVINEYCRKKVRNKTDVVAAATWALFSQTADRIEQVLEGYGESGGKLEIPGDDSNVVVKKIQKAVRSR
ncbi:MAG: hypothetical protein IID32_05805 [Planctomycetes bacterium]|nr:hypothetical protein [Planctomycetota bacterium]